MRSFVLATLLIGVHASADATKPPIEPTEQTPSRAACGLTFTSIDWDFSLNDQGFLPLECDAGGTFVWAHGAPVGVPGAPANVWGTSLAGNYPDDSGDGLRSPTFYVDDAHRYVEVHHYFDIEYGYDGANMVVRPDAAPWTPMDGYTVPEISSSGSYYAWCVDGEPGWTGSSAGWRIDCFDLSEYLGMDVHLEFDFGSDASVNAQGWYLSRVALGGIIPMGACCDPGTGDCAVTTEDVCLEGGGVWHSGRSCDPNPCVVPSSPVDLVALTQAPDRIRLEWVHDDSADEFVIERKAGVGDPWEPVQIVPGELTVWEDTGVVEGPTYYYRMRASNVQGASDVSNFAAAECGIVPDPPSNLVATAVTSTRIDLTWTDNSTNEVGFVIERKTGEFGPWKPYTAPQTNTVNYIDHWVSSNTEYTYRICAYTQFGRSAWFVSNFCWTNPDPGAITASVIVKQNGATVEGAEVYTSDGALPRPFTWTYEGETDQNGVLVVSGLHVGYLLRASTMDQIKWDCRDYNGGSSPFGTYLWYDSDVLLNNGETDPYKITSQQVTYTLNLAHPVFRFDLTMSAEWDIPQSSPYWDNLRTACQLVSDYLYDVTDGQAAIRYVRIWDNKKWWDEAHVRIYNDEWPWAETNQYWDCDWWSPEDHLHMDRDWGGGPGKSGWNTTLVHEIGHYIFDLKDEYEDGYGKKGAIAALHKQYPNLYPSNYGVMQSQGIGVEMSSQNDYIQGYKYPFWDHFFLKRQFQTEQLAHRGHSCWDHIEGKLEGLTYNVNVRKPQAGWFVSGSSSSPDRSGPDHAEMWVSVVTADSGQRIPPVVEVDIVDTGLGSYESVLTIETDRGRAADADVYSVGSNGWMHLGRTDVRGRLRAVGLRPGDTIRAYHRDGRAVRLVTHTLDAGVPPSLTLRVPTLGGARKSPEGARLDVTAPGAAMAAVPVGEAPSSVLALYMRPDEPLVAPPTIWCFAGASAGELVVEEVSEGLFRAEVEVDFADSLFAGHGLFEIAMEDLVGNPTVCIAPFHIDDVEAGEYLEAYQGPTEFNVPGPDIAQEQLYVTLSCNVVPFRTTEPIGIPVSDLFSVHLGAQDAWPSIASINVHYDDSLIVGLDETSLVLARFDGPTQHWVEADSSTVTPSWNVVSALMQGGGTYCIFATAETSDGIPPGAVDDLGAVPTDGVGAVEMLWTAPGDDGTGGGAAQEYFLAYSEEPEIDWATADKITVELTPGAPGANESTVVHLPGPGTLYYMMLRAKDEASNLGPPSNTAYVVAGIADPNLVPAVPTDFRAIDEPADEGGAVRLSWTRSADDGAGKNTVVAYNLYRDVPPASLPESLAVVPAGTTTFVDATVANDLIYTYWVSASDGDAETLAGENVALPAQNLTVPLADFTSDGKVGVNDLAHLSDWYGLLGDDVEFDPLFDLNDDDAIGAGDEAIFAELLFEGGWPVTDPVGQNGEAQLFVRYAPDEGELWHVDLSIRGASNLAGFLMEVEYPSAQALFIGATGEVVHGELPLLNREGGHTPMFIAAQKDPEPDRVWVATALQNASEVMAPEGEGYLARLTFAGPGMGATAILGVDLMDHEKHINHHTSIIVGAPEPATVLRPFLYRSYPNPCRTAAMMRFEIPEREHVTLRIFDVSGRLVRTLVDRVYEAGVHGMMWDAKTDARSEVASGVYFYRFEAGEYTTARKLLVLR